MNKVISADSHVQEPPEIFERLPKSLRHRAPRIVERDGARYLVIDGRRPRRLDIADARTTEDDRDREFREDPSEGRDIDRRLADLERDGVSAEVIYPNRSLNLFMSPAPDYQLAVAQAWNDWAIEHFGPPPDLAGINRLLYSDDCLNVLNDDLALPTGSVDLIYLDPPFNSKSIYNLPFKGKDKDARPVAAFTDTWTWGAREDDLLRELSSGPRTRYLADVVRLAQNLRVAGEMGSGDASLAPYLVNMAVRLMAMRRVLADTGSIYLHCDPTASHYLKLLMDAIFGPQNFRNEIIWRIGWVSGYKTQKRGWIRNHDVILYYVKTDKAIKAFNKEYVPYPPGYVRRDGQPPKGKGIPIEDTWNCNPADVLNSIMIMSFSGEKLGYPTQKPLGLLERIIKASSPPGGLVLDPFCGCGTAVHAAEHLGRRWVGVDVSAFSVGLMRGRILRNFAQLTTDDVLVRGVPVNVADAEELAERDKFEFEKWVCGAIGAEGMFHDPGTPGADGGVDGVLKFYPFRMGRKPKAEFAIVQVKGGRVTPDAVKALKATVDKYDATAGVMVCFNRYMRTVENQRPKATFRDDSGTYPVIQGLSIEELLADQRPNLPLYGYQPQGGRVRDQAELLIS